MSNNPGMNDGMALSNAVADGVERAGQVTVMVNARRRMPLSGILFAPDLVLTASHGVEREEDIQVGFSDGSEKTAVLAGRDRGTDLAILRLASATALPVAQPAAGSARVGHLVIAVGRPSGGGVQASLGMINAIGGVLRTQGGGLIDRYLVTDAVPYPGFSGGPLADLSGGLLGINTSGLVRGTSLAIPAELAWGIAHNLAQHGRIRHGFLGIRSQEVDLPAQSQSLGREQSSGLLIMGVEPDGPAAKSGLMVGDILVGLNGQPVPDHDTLVALLSGDMAGKPAQAQVLRGGQLQVIDVVVGEKA